MNPPSFSIQFCRVLHVLKGPRASCTWSYDLIILVDTLYLGDKARLCNQGPRNNLSNFSRVHNLIVTLSPSILLPFIPSFLLLSSSIVSSKCPTMDFAPYQSSPPSAVRAMSPPPRSPPPPQSRTLSSSPPPVSAAGGGAGAGRRTYALLNPAPSSSRSQLPSGMYSEGGDTRMGAAGAMDPEGSLYETSLGFELKVEAALAYIMLPPAGGVLLLLFEWKSDYVRCV